MITFALKYKGSNSAVDIWCQDHGALKDGTRRFQVINGGWRGHFTTDGVIIMHPDNKQVPAELIWEGEVPAKFGLDYNEVIPWITQEIAEGRKSKIPDKLQRLQLEITVTDGAGNVVEHRVHDINESDMMTQAQIDEAVALINNGCTASIAVMLAKQDPTLE